jgi:hypothetical protein
MSNGNLEGQNDVSSKAPAANLWRVISDKAQVKEAGVTASERMIQRLGRTEILSMLKQMICGCRAQATGV